MTYIVTSENLLQKIAPPNLPLAPVEITPQYLDQLNNVLRLYFNRLQDIINQLNTDATSNGSSLTFPYGAFHQDGTTTLTGAMTNVSTTPIAVVSTTAFPNSGHLLIGNEVVAYTGKTGTTFTGITRGVYGSTNVAHAIGVDVADALGVASPTSSVAVGMDSTDASNGVSIDPLDDTKVVFTTAGIYNIQFSAQLLNFTTTDDNVTFWNRLNGVDVSYSAGIDAIPSKHGSTPGAAVVGWNIVLQVAANDYIQLMYASDSGNTVVATYPAGTTPVHPVSPALILTATFVSAV